MKSSGAGRCDQEAVDKEERRTNLIVRIGMGNANLRGVLAHFPGSEKPSLLRANCVPSIVPLTYMSIIQGSKKCREN